MTKKNLIEELKNYKSICFYPSSGTDLSDIDFFCSGGLPREERKETDAFSHIWHRAVIEPELFVHSDVNFYMEFESGKDLDLSEYGIHGKYEIISFEQLESIKEPNRINNNLPYSGQVFKYKLRVWGKEETVVLIFALCENEFVASQIFLANNIPLFYVWSKNWNGGKTYGTWLARAANKLGVKLMYTDWLCLPNLRGEPPNDIVYEKYPNLKVYPEAKLVRTNNHWIEEGAHGWVDEFMIK